MRYAIDKGSVNHARALLLVDKSIQVNESPNFENMQPMLHGALNSQCAGMVSLLMSVGARLNVENSSGLDMIEYGIF